jgi:hypothetical protein
MRRTRGEILFAGFLWVDLCAEDLGADFRVPEAVDCAGSNAGETTHPTTAKRTGTYNRRLLTTVTSLTLKVRAQE